MFAVLPLQGAQMRLYVLLLPRLERRTYLVEIREILVGEDDCVFGHNKTVRQLRNNASVACTNLHARLCRLFPEWDADQRWVIAYDLTDATGLSAEK